MYKFFKRVLLKLLDVPPDPSAPAGAEDSLLVFHAARRYLHYRIALWLTAQPMALASTFVGVFLFQRYVVSHTQGGLWLLLVAGEVLAVATVLGQLVFTLILLRMDYELRWYMVTDRSVRIREGVWHVKEMTMTLANIQNLAVTRGPLQRLLGIADVKVMTAGGGGGAPDDKHGQGKVISMHTGYFRGVDNAEEIRDIVRTRLRRFRGAGLGDPDDVGRPTPAGGIAQGPALDALGAIRREAEALRRAAERVSS